MDIYAIVTDKIINLLEQGVVPWRRPWTSAGLPRNLVSKKPYRGINHFLLSASKYVSPFWLTMRQANELGGHVRKGEESTIVVFWKVEDATRSTEDLDTAEPGEKARRRFLLRYYRVWNLEQCESLLHHLKSFLGPSDPSKAGGKKGELPSARRPSGSAPGGDAPVHPGDALLVAPLGDQSGAMPGGRPCRKARESHLFGARHRLFGAPLRGRVIAAYQVMCGRKAGSLSQNVRNGRPLSHPQHLARYRPGTIRVAKSIQGKVQEEERT
jgi:hypothetical protein